MFSLPVWSRHHPVIPRRYVPEWTTDMKNRRLIVQVWKASVFNAVFVFYGCDVCTIIIIIIHCSIFSHSHWLRAYDEFFVFCWWREHMTNNYRICHVLTPSETNTRFICHVLTPSELFAVICHVCLSVYNRFRQRRLLGLLIELWFCFGFGRTNRVSTGR